MIDGNENKDCKLHRPSAVCIVENDRFIIKDNKKLYKFEADGQLVDVYDNGGQFKHLFGRFFYYSTQAHKGVGWDGFLEVRNFV